MALPYRFPLIVALVTTIAPVSGRQYRSIGEAAGGDGSSVIRAVLLGDEGLFDETQIVGDQPMLASNLPGEAGSVRDSVLYNHLPKAGGSFLKKVLRDTVGRNRFVLEREFDALSADNITSKTFTIGSIRNPCEYYVSLWAFGSEGKGSFHAFVNRYDKNLHAASASKDTDEDITRFRKWVRAINFDNETDYQRPRRARVNRDGALLVGFESARFAYSYSQEPYMKKLDVDRRLSEPPREFDTEDTHVVQHAMERFNKESIDCWVRAEEMILDTESCLRQFESQGGHVDWNEFNNGIKSEDHNPSDHAPCKAYFDEATETLVRQLEAPIFDIFGYDSCCTEK